MKVTNEQGVSFEIHKELTEYARSKQRSLPALPQEWAVVEVTRDGRFDTFLLFDTKTQTVLQELGGLEQAYCLLDVHKLAGQFNSSYEIQ